MTPKRLLGRGGVFLILLSVVLGLAGCSRKETVPTGETVRGKVFYKGQPVTFGAVHFYNQDGFVGSGYINPDGSYEVFCVPAGNVQFCVVTDPASLDHPAPVGPNAAPVSPPPLPPERPPVIEVPPGWTAVSISPPGAPFDPAAVMLYPPGEPVPPGAVKLPTPAERRTLDEIQQKYGTPFSNFKHTYTVQPGEQTCDIRLK
jgi:hypothetical protein